MIVLLVFLLWFVAEDKDGDAEDGATVWLNGVREDKENNNEVADARNDECRMLSMVLKELWCLLSVYSLEE